MPDKINVAPALRRLLKIKVTRTGDDYYLQDDAATLAAVSVGIQSILDVLEPPIGIESLTADDKETGPENTREEVVGTSTRGKSRNLGNLGFSGGRPALPWAVACELAKWRAVR